MAAAESARIQEAQKLAKSDPRKAEAIYKDIISKAPSTTSDAATREYESALISLGEIYRDEKCAPLHDRFSCAPLTITIGKRKNW
jgi:26S proteasome regulatory subunit N6